ncbi:MAG: Gfo/Idh/MocA family oxidoreductase [Gammaproteobacteria bacterium]|nr:Gfo/Idh/MocA family oxidoreductase [Gammaproteobacteria bacterium]MCH9743499.1 Gfo/Idh/MocA family oxidoreductase [Gammaproteobacteria bacterium]
MSATIKLGLIGAGRWGRNYIKTIQQLDGITLTGLATRNPDNAALVDKNCVIVSDWRELLKNKHIQGIILAVPAPQQFSIAMAIVESKKALLLEKPMAISCEQAVALQRQIKQHQSIAMIDHTQLFDPVFRQLKQQIGHQKIKALSIIAGKNGGFRQETSVLWDWGPHVVAMCLDLLNEPLVQLQIRRIVSDDNANGHAENLSIKCFSEKQRIPVEMNIGNLFKQKTRCIEVHTDARQYIYKPDAEVPLTCWEDGKAVPVTVNYRPPLDVVVEEFSSRIRDQNRNLDQIEQGVKIIEILESLDECLYQKSA